MSNLVISQTPYRISLGGGGTDLPFYANERGGKLITAAINQYVKVSAAKRPLDDRILVQTTEVQFSKHLDGVDNPLIREALRYFKINKAIQIATFTTIPTGIGLGSSSTVMVGLINVLSKIINKDYSALELARIAHYIERELLGHAGGVQDQYIAAIGGIQILDIAKSGKISCTALLIDEKIRLKLQNHLVLIFIGQERQSKKIIQSQTHDLTRTFEVYDEIKVIGHESVDLLINGDIEGLGKVMDRHWAIKRTLSTKMTTNDFDELYIKLKQLGSPGGKIIGAGGGGFFMMAVPGNVENYIEKVKALGIRRLDWNFDFNGSHILEMEG